MRKRMSMRRGSGDSRFEAGRRLALTLPERKGSLVIGGYVQVVERLPDGREGVLEPCMKVAVARSFLKVFNSVGRGTGSIAVSKPMLLPSLARDSLAKHQ